MSNSPLVSYTKLSPNHSGQRTHRLKAAGYDPSVIQNRVNQLLK